MKISQKLILLFLTIALVPIFGVGFFSYITTQRNLSSLINTQINNTADREAVKINNLVEQNYQMLNIFTLRQQLRFATDTYLTTKAATDQQALDQLLTDISLDNRGFRRIHVLDMQGKIIGSSDERFIGKDYADSEVFAKGKEKPDVSIFFKDIDGELTQYLTAPFYSSNLTDRQIGVVIIENQVESYLLITQDYSDLAQTGEAFLRRRLDSGQLEYMTPSRFDENLALQLTSQVKDDMDYRGHVVLAANRDITNMPWVLTVKIDQAEVYRPVVEQRNISLAIMAGAAVVIIVVVFYFSNLITGPIQRLTQVALRIRHGDLKQRVKVESRDEIGLLGSAFNEMTNELAAANAALEQKVFQRTKALNQKLVELEAAHAKDNAILGSIGDGLIVTDANGHILLINALAAELLGAELSTAKGKNVTEITLYDETEQPLSPSVHPITFTLATGRKVVQEVKAIQGNVKRALNIIATPVVQQGRIIGAIQTVHDITKEKEIDRMKTEFISIASHQLRTPLSAISWFSEMLLNGDAGALNDEQKEFAQNVSDSTQRMIDLVNSLLNISRIESGRIIVDPKPTDLSKLVSDIITDLKGKTEEKKQTLIVSVHKDLPQINLDPHLIGQVYLNLLTNAIKYTPKGGEITVLISRKENMAISQVTDNGYGIPKAEQSKMFQKFFRASNIAKVETDGTGLGMYLVKSIIESSGGKIWFQSDEGKGTTFWFSLPLSGMRAKAGEVTID